MVNLITRLRGQAYAFYRSCTVAQRRDYNILMPELEKRFTPVTIQAVQTSLFHESVDAYAQDLRQLFLKAYLSAQQGSREAEEIGNSVHSSQFVAGLGPVLKNKIAGLEGDIDSLLIRARFKEAKDRSFREEATKSAMKKSTATLEGSKPSPGEQENKVRYAPRTVPSHLKCHSCGGAGHFTRNCPLKNKGGPREATGHKVATVVPQRKEGGKEASWQDCAVDEELQQVLVTTHGVNITEGTGGILLGKTLVTKVVVEGIPRLRL